MAFEEYTKCIKPGNFIDLSPDGWKGKAFIATAGVSALSMLILTAIGAGTAAVINAIVVFTQVIVYLRWWLYGRLICLGDDARNCAIIGKVDYHGSNPKKKGGDNDYTMNLLLAPRDEYDEGTDKAGFTPDVPQGHLYADHADITGLGLEYAGQENNRKYWQGLHVEFEGAGIYELYQWAIAMLAILSAALIVPPPFNTLIVIAAILILLIKFLTGLDDSKENPTLDTPLDTDSDGSTITKGSIVVLKGEWIFDSGHRPGKNEIHPIRDCIIIGHLDKDQTWEDLDFVHPETGNPLSFADPADVETIREIWCGALRDAEDAEDTGSRSDPLNEWGIHPDVDGCKEPVIIT